MSNSDPILYMYLFYLTLAIFFLGGAILVYPTLKSSSRKK